MRLWAFLMFFVKTLIDVRLAASHVPRLHLTPSRLPSCSRTPRRKRAKISAGIALGTVATAAAAAAAVAAAAAAEAAAAAAAAVAAAGPSGQWAASASSPASAPAAPWAGEAGRPRALAPPLLTGGGWRSLGPLDPHRRSPRSGTRRRAGPPNMTLPPPTLPTRWRAERDRAGARRALTRPRWGSPTSSRADLERRGLLCAAAPRARAPPTRDRSGAGVRRDANASPRSVESETQRRRDI